jgi:hypothetical protein
MTTRLTKEIQIMIVTQLACYTRPSDVRDMVEKEFGVVLPLTTVDYYDPSRVDTNVGPKWRALFAETRKQYMTELARVPIMHKAYRMHQLQRALEKEWSRENTVGVRDTLKQAAEEEGGIFTNRREFTGAGGKDLPAATVTVRFVDAAGQAVTP